MCCHNLRFLTIFSSFRLYIILLISFVFFPNSNITGLPETDLKEKKISGIVGGDDRNLRERKTVYFYVLFLLA